MSDTIGKVTHKAKIAAGLFWADYSVLGGQVKDLQDAGVDWFHVEVRDGKYMDFGMPRGGFDIIGQSGNTQNDGVGGFFAAEPGAARHTALAERAR